MLYTNRRVEELNITNNKIPDRFLKVLLALLVVNPKIEKIEYSLNEKENIQKREKFRERIQLKPYDSHVLHDFDHHHHATPLWQKIIFPIWIWQTFIHAKHEAFRFKYDAEKLNRVENKLMKRMGNVLYFTTLIYFGMLFVFPFSYTNRECGDGFELYVYICYGIYALLTSIWEVYAVL